MTSCRDRIRNQIRKPIRLFVSHKLNGEVTKKLKQQKEVGTLQGVGPAHDQVMPGERAHVELLFSSTHIA